MSRVGEDEGGGGSNAEKTGNSFGGWFGGAARAMTGGSGGTGYVVLGGPRYGLHLSQVNYSLTIIQKKFSKKKKHLKNIFTKKN